MTILLTGEAGVFSVDDIAEPTLTAPANGNPVDATVIIAAAQRILDYLAQTGTSLGQLTDTVYNGKSRGVTVVSSVAALKAWGTMVDGDQIVIRDPTYSGGASGIVSRVGMFVYDSGSTLPETDIPGLSDAYLVITPNSGIGRWINIVAGVGWKLGGSPEFQPKQTDRSRLFVQTQSTAGTDTVGYVSGFQPIGVVLSTDLLTSDFVSLDFNMCLRSLIAVGGDQLTLRIESSVNGDTYQEVLGSRVYFDGQNQQAFKPIHLGGVFSAGSDDAHDFRVTVSMPSGGSVEITRTATARALSYNAT